MSEALKSLSVREQETLRLLLAGHDAKSIARNLGLSVHTVNDRLRDSRHKLGVSSSREAARLLAQADAGCPNSLAPKIFGVADQAIGTQQKPRTGAHPIASGGWQEDCSCYLSPLLPPCSLAACRT